MQSVLEFTELSVPLKKSKDRQFHPLKDKCPYLSSPGQFRDRHFRRAGVMPSQEKWDRLLDAYRQMAERVSYRPGAPSDGFGHVTVPTPELEVSIEAREYCQHFLQEEDEDRYWVGNPDFRANRAFIWTLEALRLMCGGATWVGEESDDAQIRKMAVPRLLAMAREEYLREF